MDNCSESPKDQTNENKTALVVDDDQWVSDLLCRVISRSGFKVISASSCHEATQHILQDTLQLIMLDVNLPDGCGLDLISEIKELQPNAIVITMTGDNPAWVEEKSKELKVAHHIVKPFELSDLIDIISDISNNLK